MSNSYISFYLKAYRIHVFTDTLRAIDSPKRICFLVDKDIKHLAITPYHMRDLKSHSVPDDVYSGSNSLEISSFPLCQLISKKLNWEFNCSYRVLGKVGKISSGQKAVVFNLTYAEKIKDTKNG
ncbi:MAG: hypothetical protein U0M60_03365, partial [Clostridia bacterium]|nr:hypothetical protein [Clostridia bacterium]